MFLKFIQLLSLSYLFFITVSHSNSLIILIVNSIINCDSSSSDNDFICYNLFKKDKILSKKKEIYLYLWLRALKSKIMLQFIKFITKDHSKQ